MYIDIDIEPEIINAVEEYLAGGGDVVTYKEHTDLMDRVEELEKRIRDIDFWKADRNHSHNLEGERVK